MTILAANDYAPTILATATLVTALGAFISSLLNRGANARTERKTEEVAAKVDVVAAHVNSKATADNAEIKSLQKQNADLLVLLADSKTTAQLLAQSAAISGQTAVAAGPAPVEVKVINPTDEPVPIKSTR